MSGSMMKRSINLSGHATSLALEPEFWRALQRMADVGSLAALIGAIDSRRGQRSLASACRVAALEWAMTRSPEGRAEDLSPQGI